MKKLLITGATGFIGSHLTEHCVNLGYDVTAFDRYNSNNHWGWLENSDCKDTINVILGDIRDYDSIYKAMKGCDIVLHLAALIGIPYSYVSPLAYIRTNIEGTYNVLEASKDLNLEQVLITSTSETYGSAQYVPIDEGHPASGQSPYSATKIGADSLSLSYFKSFDLPVKIVRPFNTYGPRQSARAIIPTIISQLENGSKLNIGNVNPTRDFTFVTDTCSGFIEILKSNTLFGTVTNIGMNKEISIAQLTQKISQLMGKEAEIIVDEKRLRPVNSEVDRLCCNNSKLLQHTKWESKVSLDDGLKIVINWVRKNVELFKSDQYNV